MGWSNLPVSDSETDVHAWPFLRQFRDAIDERMQAAGSYYWPRASRTWGPVGTVPSGITATSFTDPEANDGDGWCIDKNIPWACVNGDIEQVPTVWYLVIDSCVPEECVRTLITGYTTDTLTYEDISDQVTAGYPASLADLEGRPYYIVGYTYAVWWNERVMGGSWMTIPNDEEWASGTVRAYFDDPDDPGAQTNPTPTTIKDDEKGWAEDEHVGRDLLVYGDDGRLHRVAVAANTSDTLTFATQSWTPSLSAPYCVVSSGGRAVPGKDPLRPFLAYAGNKRGYYSHAADDALGSAAMPVSQVHVEGADDHATCDGTDQQSWDADYWMDFPLGPADVICGAKPDKPYNVNVWKSLRSWQLATEYLSSQFVEVKDYEDEPAIPLMNSAVLFNVIGVNSFTATIGAVTGVSGGGHTSNTITFTSIAAPVTPHNIYWAVIKADGEYKSGTGILSTSTALSAYSTGSDQFDDRTDVGLTVIVSYGWSRYVAREFKRMFPACCFIPDEVVIDGVPGIIDPPETDFEESGCSGVGQWVRHLPSTKYIDRNVHTAAWTEDAVGFARDGTETFVTGEYARYAGDNMGDPSVTGLGGSYPDGPQVQYFDFFYNGSAAPATQRMIEKQQGGRAIKGSTTQLTQADHNWFDCGWFGGGVLRTESGTATGGSTTSLTDATKGDDAEEPNCWWADLRFNGFDPWVGFTVEVLMSGASWTDPEAVIEKRLVTSGSPTGTIGWAVALPASASGKQYRIREPQYELNRWEGRTVALRRVDPDDGTVTTDSATILGNDDATLFFAAVSFAVDEHTTFSIADPRVGGVYRWTGTAWEVASGDDAARTGVPTPAPFHRNPTENLPTYVLRYGKLLPGDAICSELFDELHAALDALRWRRFAAAQTSRAVSGTPENNQLSGTGDSSLGSLGDDKIKAVDRYNGVYLPIPNPASEHNDPPTAFAILKRDMSISDGYAGYDNCTITRRYAYFYATIPLSHCPLASASDWYAYGTIDEADHAAGYDAVNKILYAFDDNGDAVGDHAFKQFATDAATTDTDRQQQFGSLDVPNWPAEPPAVTYPNVERSTSGYWVAKKWVVVRYDVDGGLQYVAP